MFQGKQFGDRVVDEWWQFDSMVYWMVLTKHD
jgi:hypothetical protein